MTCPRCGKPKLRNLDVCGPCLLAEIDLCFAEADPPVRYRTAESIRNEKIIAEKRREEVKV